MPRAALLAALLLSFALPSPSAKAQDEALDINPEDVIIWQAVGATVLDAGEIEVVMDLTTKDGFTIYKDKLAAKGPTGFSSTGIAGPNAKSQFDPITQTQKEVYDGGRFTFKFSGLAPPKDLQAFTIALTSLGCTTKICLFPHTQTFDVPLGMVTTTTTPGADLFGEPAFGADDSQSLKDSDLGLSGQDVRPEQAEAESIADLEQGYAKGLMDGTLPFSTLLIVIFIGGLLTNLTPCVFPMIPITIRILGRSGTNPFAASLLYVLGIILSYSLLGFIIAMTGGLFGAFLANPYVNIALGVVFSLFALSMLGFGNLSFLQNFGNRLGSGPPSAVNLLLMGAGAGLVAAPCTGPILGALIAYTAKTSQGAESFWLFCLYAVGFALPYLFLGMAAGKISRLKVPSVVQVSVKYFFAAAMFALAFYFVRVNFYEWLKVLEPFWYLIGNISFLIALSVLLIAAMRGIYQTSKGYSVILSLMLGFSLFAFSQGVTTAPTEASALTWHKTDTAALEAAKTSNKPVLIDGWAEWCEACKKMERTTFKDPAVIAELKNWSIAKVDLTKNDEKDMIIINRYGLNGLPAMVMLPPGGSNDKTKREKISGYVTGKKLLSLLQSYRAKHSN